VDNSSQTIVVGSQIEQALQGITITTESVNRADSVVKSQGVRVGGGGEIKKPAPRQVNPNAK
jgi:hypothetical protein